jgi:D-lactate dehydrogenase
MKVIAFYNEEWEREHLVKNLAEHELVLLKGHLADHPYLGDSETGILGVFVTDPIGIAELGRFPNLKAIVTFSTGHDHIDKEAAHKKNIVVVNVPTYGENTVAEYTFALLLSLSRRVFEAYDRIVKSGTFKAEGLRGFDICCKTMGVVGTGHIGARVIKIAKGFGMNVVAFDMFPNEKLAKELDFTYVSLDELLGQSDVISLHTPLTKDTNHMINENSLPKIKRGAYLINTSRGALVETKALVMGLEQGVFAGAGLDVLEEEGSMDHRLELIMGAHPNPESLRVILENQYLIDHPGVIITPHNAFNTREAITRILNTSIENIKAIAKGEPINIVN